MLNKDRSVLSLTEKRKFVFLLKFTHELIENSDEGNVSDLEKVLEKQRVIFVDEDDKKEQIKKIVKEKISDEKSPFKKKIISKRILKEIPDLMPRRKPKFNVPSQSVLRIPEPKLPPEFQYLRPVPKQKEMDLGKLNPLIKDPMVLNIECAGPDKRIVVSGRMGTKPTNIILNDDEVNEVIGTFSEASKIPVHAGVYKVVVGTLILSAIVSDVVGTRFIIRKMRYTPNQVPAPGQTR